MKSEFTYPSTDGKTNIHAIIWKPETEPKAVLQIAHGMVEYIDRYDAFANYMSQHGYVVVGNDHLGHGASVLSDEDHGYFADKDGNMCVIGDIHKLRLLTHETFPNIPYIMMGHSMGSFLIRQYITIYGEGLAGTIIMGTGSQPGAVLGIAKTLCKIIAAFKGWRHRSNMINNMAFGSYNKEFKPARTPNDWLTKDESIVDAYLSNPWCTFVFTLNAYYNMFVGIGECQSKTNIAKIPKNLPLLLTSGIDDPLSAKGKNIIAIAETYKTAGISDITVELYENDRHEILNELDKDKVFADVLTWCERQI